ncbi:MAG: class I SAM-dependent methyltransferase [Desulfobacteraceae bacterium]|nr:MAG: class I SAM-dependent methyltransferase [Desulfobacteraceae bacterium]
MWKKWLSFRHYRLVRGPLTYNQDGLATKHNCDFIHDPRFAGAYQRGKETGSWRGAEIHWRAYVACWAAERACGIAGDFVECGVNKGGLARTVMEYVDFAHLPKTFFLLDTFSGLVEKYISPQEQKEGILPGGYEECHEHVLQVFSKFGNVKIIRGAVPETLELVNSRKVAYLSLDMNCTEPEIAAAEFFWDKMEKGAMVLIDDYGWKGHIVQKKAFDDFACRKQAQLLSLPTGQGLIIK